jgi:hypothetical protein
VIEVEKIQQAVNVVNQFISTVSNSLVVRTLGATEIEVRLVDSQTKKLIRILEQEEILDLVNHCEAILNLVKK